jgi:hypothetical protein
MEDNPPELSKKKITKLSMLYSTTHAMTRATPPRNAAAATRVPIKDPLMAGRPTAPPELPPLALLDPLALLALPVAVSCPPISKFKCQLPGICARRTGYY